MNCLKCGREIISGQVFCEECLLEMAKYPVDPDTPVAIPHRTQTANARKTAKKRTPSPAEQIASLRKLVRFLTALLIVFILLVLILIDPALAHLMKDNFAPGQNYSSYTSTTGPVATETLP